MYNSETLKLFSMSDVAIKFENISFKWLRAQGSGLINVCSAPYDLCSAPCALRPAPQFKAVIFLF
jgi:hypothetical protein